MLYTPTVTCTLRHCDDMFLFTLNHSCTRTRAAAVLAAPWADGFFSSFKWLWLNMHLNCTNWIDKHKHANGHTGSPLAQLDRKEDLSPCGHCLRLFPKFFKHLPYHVYGSIQMLAFNSCRCTIYRYYSDKNHKFAFISMARNAASMKSPNPLPLLSDCASASVNEAVIHNQPWLIKRLSRDVPPQWVGWLSAVATDRNRAEFYCPRWTLLSFHFTSSLHLFFSVLSCSQPKFPLVPSRVSNPWKVKSLGLIAAQPPKLHQREHRLCLSTLSDHFWVTSVFRRKMRDQRAQTADSWAVI